LVRAFVVAAVATGAVVLPGEVLEGVVDERRVPDEPPECEQAASPESHETTIVAPRVPRRKWTLMVFTA
jgi:hypothetical protein